MGWGGTAVRRQSLAKCLRRRRIAKLTVRISGTGAADPRTCVAGSLTIYIRQRLQVYRPSRVDAVCIFLYSTVLGVYNLLYSEQLALNMVCNNHSPASIWSGRPW